MEDRPDGLDENVLRRALSAWEVDAVRLEYAPVGFGDYHWTAGDSAGRRWFVTVADLENKSHCGLGAEAALRGLRGAMDTAAALRAEQGLDFVVAPLIDGRGDTVRRLGHRYAVSVFPFMDGTTGDFGQAPTPQERGLVVDLLAELHRAAPPAETPVLTPELSTRAGFEHALGDTGRARRGGPFAESARALLSDHTDGLRRRLAEFDRRAAELSGRPNTPVVTHGEPHPGNLLRIGDRHLLVDWDTAGLAVPERDLWSVATEPDDLARYADATGHDPDPSALALYRLRWDLEDAAVYVDLFRSPHDRTPDTEAAWAGLVEIVNRLTGGGPA